MSGELPKGWVTSGLLEIVNLHDRYRIPLNHKERESRKGIYPYYGANGQVGSIDGYIFDGDYILIAEDGGYFDDRTKGVAYRANGKFWVNNHAHIIEALGGIPHGYLEKALNQYDWMRVVGGSTRLKLTQEGMQRVNLPLAPLPEQHRIVAKIDSLFARSSRARDELAHIPRLIERYRQAVLEAAFRGDLTADWREKTSSPVWREVTARELFKWGSGKNLPKNSMQVGEYPVYGGNGITGFHCEANSLVATIIVGRVGALCGNVYVSDGPSWVTDNAIYATNFSSQIRLRFAQLVFFFAKLRERATGSGQPFVSQQILNEVIIPLPSLAEQDEIISTFDKLTGAIDQILTEQRAAVALLHRLDASILDKAFSGQLVPQDPNDEPASKLLDRIRAARAATPAVKRGRKAKGAADGGLF